MSSGLVYRDCAAPTHRNVEFHRHTRQIQVYVWAPKFLWVCMIFGLYLYHLNRSGRALTALRRSGGVNEPTLFDKVRESGMVLRIFLDMMPTGSRYPFRLESCSGTTLCLTPPWQLPMFVPRKFWASFQ